MSIEISKKQTYTPVCDGCGDSLEPCDTRQDAVEAMREQGWKTRREDGELCNYCEDCCGG